MVITGCELDVICASLVVYLSSVSQCASNLGGLRTVKVFETDLCFPVSAFRFQKRRWNYNSYYSHIKI